MSFVTANKHEGVPFIRDFVGVRGVRGGGGVKDRGTGWTHSELTLTTTLSAKDAGLSTSVKGGGPVPMIFQRT